MAKGIGFYIGFAIGWFRGYRDGRKFHRLIKYYGGLRYIPTRELNTIGEVGWVVVRRQRVLIAIEHLCDMVEALGLKGIPNTAAVISKWIAFMKIDSDAMHRIDSLSRSQSVVHALVDFAVEQDGFDKDLLLAELTKTGHAWVWEKYRSNDTLMVS